MSQDQTANGKRPWRQIAEELCRETDSNKIYMLSIELDRALEEQEVLEGVVKRLSYREGNVV